MRRRTHRIAIYILVIAASFILPAQWMTGIQAAAGGIALGYALGQPSRESKA